ncbi:hypothetical protein [Bacteroides finegoldii]|uniref:hypothetical protein n=1 Tax=Bacteroides finegoldii TaxID=338188 RepID=UPI002666ADE0|nr:hypothetical protein [Bacteroides finegoldii]
MDEYPSQYSTAFLVGTKLTPLYPEKITDDISFGKEIIELKWGEHGKMPEYLLLVSGLFYYSSFKSANQ